MKKKKSEFSKWIVSKYYGKEVRMKKKKSEFYKMILALIYQLAFIGAIIILFSSDCTRIFKIIIMVNIAAALFPIMVLTSYMVFLK
jgi:presenilin-like A22 family membrane protease